MNANLGILSNNFAKNDDNWYNYVRLGIKNCVKSKFIISFWLAYRGF